MTQKIIIDADPGIGDALAILTALVDPSLEVVGLTATAGTVSGIQATRNLQYLIELVDPLKRPRIGECGRGSAVVGVSTDETQTRHSYCGRHGLGDLEVSVPDLHNRRDSAKLIVELVQEFPHEVRLLTLGPLTNLATAIELDPELPSLLEAAICLGGTNTAPGDVSAVAEFNIWCDPESAAMVFESDIPRIAVPLDVSGSAMLTFEDVDVLTELISGTRHDEVLSSMLQFSLRANHQLAMEGIPLHGVVALAVAAKAEAYSLEAARVDVETSGELTRGMTVVDRRPGYKGQTNVDLVSSVDELGVVDYFSRSLRRVAG
ncbi:nucleoside hydrolase [Fuerstiella marisgermanici]|uniref:Pyrimidine-specific ribonucleoside hydrolase RihA n=1 Tax=Fuerstiella marisgermanici TaxID=1891926 RepID=A0A1P8WFF9_9PLAN|nr:nucleoside hydrolase [Fuerstiella marisgermanici]APZ92805.1 Pyrimidine-specific ribonucleoside hydrolase RihA [Fuerstiella marisgermanici]